MRKLLFILFICGIFTTSQAQSVEIGGWLGGASYFGDLNPSFEINRVGIAGGALGRINVNRRLALKLGLNYGRVSAYDSDSDEVFRYTRNLSFRSDIYEFALQGEFNFLEYIHGSRDKFFSPYVFAGFNVYSYNPKTELDGIWYSLPELGTEGQYRGEEYYTNQLGFVYGAGIKIALNYEWSINLDLNSRFLFNDYLDDVSGTYADPDDLLTQRGPVAVALADRSIDQFGQPAFIGEPGRQRGNSQNRDYYVFVGVAIVYTFANLECPEFLR